MFYYYYLMLLIVIFFISEINASIKKQIFVFIIISLFIISGFRVGVKPDYFNYEYFYNLVASGYDYAQYGLYGIEDSFLIISDFFSMFDYGFRYTMILYSLLTLIFIGLSYPKLTREPLLALIIYYSFFFIIRDMGVIRAGLSYSILVFSLVFLFEKRIFCFLFFVLFASIFHKSAMIFTVLTIFIFYKPKVNALFLMLLVSIIFYFSGAALLIIEKLSYGAGYIAGKFQDYGKESELNYSLGFLDINNVKNIALSLMGIYIIKSKVFEDYKFDFLLLIFLIGTCVRIVFLDFSSIAGRLSSIFLSVEPLYLSMMVGALPDRKLKYLGYIVVLFYCFGILYLGIDKYETFEYKTVFGELF